MKGTGGPFFCQWTVSFVVKKNRVAKYEANGNTSQKQYWNESLLRRNKRQSFDWTERYAENPKEHINLVLPLLVWLFRWIKLSEYSKNTNELKENHYNISLYDFRWNYLVGVILSMNAPEKRASTAHLHADTNSINTARKLMVTPWKLSQRIGIDKTSWWVL